MTSISINTTDPTPPYEQIRRQITLLIDSQTLQPGEKLPTVRQLAGDLRVAPGTVSRAFKELETQGYIETRRAAGTRVRERDTPPTRSSEMNELAREFIHRARVRGAKDEEIRQAVEQQLTRPAHLQRS